VKNFRPIFLIGPGRSGTTLLYKLLSLHPSIGYVSNYDARFPHWLPTACLSRLVAGQYQLKERAWFSVGGNAYTGHRQWLRRIVPTPVEGEALYARSGLSTRENKSAPAPEVLHRLRKEFIRLQWLQGSDAILSKRTANNRRIPSLTAAFPEALYLNLIRDGRAVAESLTKVAWWNDHPLWWAGDKTPRSLAQDGMNMLAIAARNWTEEVRTIREGLAILPAATIMPVRYEQLLKSPLPQLNELLEFIGVEKRADYDLAIGRLGISERRESWKTWTAQQLAVVTKIQSAYLQSLNYL
jgi:LPS sulfotransferase NodH